MTNGQYWEVNYRNENDVKLALLKLGLKKDDDIFNAMMIDHNIYSPKNKNNKLYMFKYLNSDGEISWIYSFSDIFVKYKYNGEVEITELDKNVDKYNL